MEIKDFWEEAHKNNEELWLTGSYLNQVWDALHITSKIKKEIKVLNIGVGMGRDTEELVKRGAIVDVLDISRNALDRVKSITRNQYLSSFIDDLPVDEYDIAVSHLVTQHMNYDDLKKQIEYVLRSLKETGIFGMQFAFIDETPEAVEHLNRVYVDVIDTPPEQKGHMFRTLDKMRALVEECGGKITWVSDVRTYPDNPIKWYYIHIMLDMEQWTYGE